MIHIFGVIFSYIFHKGRTAGGCFPFLFLDGFHKFLCFLNGNHITGNRRLNHIIEAKLLNAGKHLPNLDACILAGNRRRNHGINVVACVVPRIAQKIQHVHNKGFIHNRTEGALLHAGTAGNTFIMVNHRFSVFIHLDRIDGAGTHARTHDLTDGTKGTDLLAASTFDAHFLIDICSVVYNGNGVPRTILLTFMPQTAAAGIADHETVNRTFVTGRIQHVDYTVALCRLQNQTHTVLNNMALLINTAAEGCLWPRNNRFRNLLFHIDFLI